jgi:hypothetical protein
MGGSGGAAALCTGRSRNSVGNITSVLASSSSSGREEIAVVFFRYDAKSDEESIRDIPFNRIMPDAVSRPANQPRAETPIKLHRCGRRRVVMRNSQPPRRPEFAAGGPVNPRLTTGPAAGTCV